MRTNKEFAGICSDYAEIIDEIDREERTLGHSRAVLADFHRLRSDLESDIVDRLSEADEGSAASKQDPDITRYHQESGLEKYSGRKGRPSD